jgi:hypothetical protein
MYSIDSHVFFHLTKGSTMKILKVKVKFTEEVLGTASANKQVHEEYIAARAASKEERLEEIAAISDEEVFEKALTVFPRDEEGNPAFWNYQWKGFLKEAAKALNRSTGYLTSKANIGKEMRAYRQIIDKCIFVGPRLIPIIIPKKKEMGICQRPLRGNTPQGERVALASSETVPEGSTCTFEIKLLNDGYEKYVKEWLEYGELGGTGQWRNSGKGTFTVEYLKK